AATAELRARIRHRLHQAAEGFGSACQRETPKDDPFLNRLIQDVNPDFWPECVRRLRLAEQAMDEAAIYTIHGWSRRMLSSFALLSRDLFEQTHLDNPNALLQQLVRDHWRKWFYPLPFELQGVVLHQIGANPDVLLEKIRPHWKAWDLRPPSANQEHAPPPLAQPVNILQPFLEWQRQEEALQAKARQAWQSHIPDLLHDARSQGLIRGAGISDKHFPSWVSQLTDWAEHGRSITHKTLARFTTEKLQSCGWQDASRIDFFHQVSDWVKLVEQKPACAELLIEHAAHELRAAYQQAKLEQSQFDFNDLLQRLHHALQQDKGELADAIRQQYPVAMVDEFQDTDPWQYESLDRIYDRTRVHDKNALVMIGDPKQAIYSFRGADLDTYLWARNTALDIDANACHTLDTNYRSAPGLVNAVNLLFGSLSQPFRSKQETIAFVRVNSAAKAVPLADASGQAVPPLTVWHLPLPEGITDKPFWPSDAHVQTMAKGFATQMVKLLHSHPDIHPGQMAVLVRSHAHAQTMQSALARVGLPSVFLSDHANVYQSPEAADLWRVLRAISMPRHMRWLRSAMASKLWAWPINGLTQAMHDPELSDALAESCQQWLQVWQRQGVLPMLYQWMHSQQIAKRLLSQPQGDRRLTNLLQLGELLQTAAVSLQGPQALLQFLEQQLQTDSDNPEAQKMRLETDAHCVQVVTFHKSKGLEYPLVFVPFLGNFKTSAGSKDEDTDITDTTVEEDMRLLYVALTRAQRGMWLGVAATSNGLSGKSKTLKRSAVSQMLQRQHHEDLPERLQALLGHSPDIAVAALPPADSVTYQAPQPQSARQGARVAHRKPYTRWWLASFSSLTRGIEAGSPRE
ncbi:MAG: UvrD-helicase domain-containing protein, partial [Limnohabitans sp.]